MRTFFLLLLLANVAFFAWSRHAGPPGNGADPAPLAREIEPDKLKVIAPGELPPPTPTPKPEPAPAAAAACLEWGSFTPLDADRAAKALEPLALGERLEERRTLETADWWVFIPSQGSRQAAQRKASELKELGVHEFFVIPEDGAYRWAVSLGVFRTEDAAQARLAALRRQGVRSAEVGERETMVPKVWLRVREMDAALEARLKDIARGFDGSELRSCP